MIRLSFLFVFQLFRNSKCFRFLQVFTGLLQLPFASLQLVTLTADRTALNVTPKFTIWTRDLFPLFALHLLFIPVMLGQFVPRHRRPDCGFDSFSTLH